MDEPPKEYPSKKDDDKLEKLYLMSRLNEDEEVDKDINDLYRMIKLLNECIPSILFGEDMYGENDDKMEDENDDKLEVMVRKNSYMVKKVNRVEKKIKQVEKKLIRMFYLDVTGNAIDEEKLDQHYEKYKNEIHGIGGWYKEYIAKNGTIPPYYQIPKEYKYKRMPTWVEQYVQKIKLVKKEKIRIFYSDVTGNVIDEKELEQSYEKYLSDMYGIGGWYKEYIDKNGTVPLYYQIPIEYQLQLVPIWVNRYVQIIQSSRKNP